MSMSIILQTMINGVILFALNCEGETKQFFDNDGMSSPGHIGCKRCKVSIKGHVLPLLSPESKQTLFCVSLFPKR